MENIGTSIVNALNDAVRLILTFIPRLIGFLIILLVGWLIALVLAFATCGLRYTSRYIVRE